ncbi:MAG: HD family hydrolase [Stappiaceae bacterium]
MAADQPGQTPRAWQRMLSGRRLDLIDPSPLDIEISDIAHGLARVARWNGQTLGDHAFSVAQHSVVVEQISTLLKPDLEAHWRLAILLHDAPEYVIGDMISPFKTVMGGNYKQIENNLHRAIHLRFSLPIELPKSISRLAKRADIISAYYEATELAGFEKVEAARIFGRPTGFDFKSKLDFTPWPTAKSQEVFLDRFSLLESECSTA